MLVEVGRIRHFGNWSEKTVAKTCGTVPIKGTNSAVWPVPYACTQPYHPGSGSHGQVMAIPRSWHVSISVNIGLVKLLLGTRKMANSWPARHQYRSQNPLRAYFGTSSFPVFKAANAPFSDSEPHNPVQKFSTTYTETTFATLRHWKPLPNPAGHYIWSQLLKKWIVRSIG